MQRRSSVLVVSLFAASLWAAAVSADVWRWVDASGNTHYVDSNQAIYTWSDEHGKVHYSDKPDHEDAIRVQLFWHSDGTVAELAAPANEAVAGSSGYTHPGETAEERAKREATVAHNCKRANEILEAYENAPKLYRTTDAGQRYILTDAEYAAEIAAAREKTRYLCSQ
jgi:hypothetical protein